MNTTRVLHIHMQQLVTLSAAKEAAEATEAFKPYLTISDVYKRSYDSLNK